MADNSIPAEPEPSFIEATFDTELKLEKEHIRKGRERRLRDLGDEETLPWCGIGLSGGGIRSACLALGVLQALAENNLLARFDYVSSVSGGGYIGASLQWWWARIKRDDGKPKSAPAFGLDPDNFPYGPSQRPVQPAKPGSIEERAIKNLDFLRSHASFLTPGNGLSVWSMLVVLFRTIIISLVIWLPLLTTCFVVLHLLDYGPNWLAQTLNLMPPLAPGIIPALWDIQFVETCAREAICSFGLRASYALLIYGFYIAAVAFGLAAVVYGLLSRTPQEMQNPKKMRLSAGLAAAGLLFVIIWSAFGTSSIDVGAAVFIFAVTLFSSSILIRISTEQLTEKSFNASYWLRRVVERKLGQYFLPSILLLIIGLIPILPYKFLNDDAHGSGLAGAFSLLSGVASALYGYYTFVRNISPGWAGRVAATLGSAIFLYGGLVLAYWLSIAVVSVPEFIASSKQLVQILAWCFLVMAVAVGFKANINYVGLHRFYRDRLMETFMPNDRAVENGRSSASAVADSLSVADLVASSRDDPDDDSFVPKPYPLINANVILVNDDYAKFAARGGANFLISPMYVGSSATGWQRTSDYIELNGPLTLPTAMAASGAAASASAGSLGTGITMNPLVSAVMALLNIRLGVWVGNPGNLDRRRLKSIPTFINPGLPAGILGQGHRRTNAYIELTDGGHFENLAMYELVRRKLGLILVVDGEADPNISLSSLVSAKNRIEQDFGARLDFFENQGPELLVMHPERGYPLDVKYARSPFIAGRLTYNDGTAGTFIYIKSNVTPNLDFSTAGYLASNPDFPHQTTVDQFFSPDQFEAYRKLGVESASRMIETLKLVSLISDPGRILDTYQESGPGLPEAAVGEAESATSTVAAG